MVGTFDDTKFWTALINQKIDLFSKEEKLNNKDLKAIINDYLFTEKKPLRDEVSKAMINKPMLKDRAKTIIELTEKIIALANELAASTIM